MSSLYQAHLVHLQQATSHLLEESGFTSLLIFSGRAEHYFLDDYHPPFKANPHFLYWMPMLGHVQESWLCFTPGQKPVLYLHSPDDFWHITTAIPQEPWCDYLEIELFCDASRLPFAAPGQSTALISPQPFDLQHTQHNPAELLHGLHFLRAVKTPWEQHCLRCANQLAARGHQAAEALFAAEKASEYQLHLTYLEATGQLDNETPYSNIVALNEHAAVLHYQHKARIAPDQHRTLLLDAGATVEGYAADITRTFSHHSDDFAALIKGLDQAQQALLADIRPGLSFTDLHLKMHSLLADLLAESGMLKQRESLSVSDQTRITAAFFPHGLGHLLGLQVHDIGGRQQTRAGQELPPPAEHPFLRLTRTLETGFVVTIEPGLYFIDSLLRPLRNGPLSRYLDWNLIDTLTPWGGIRIEDNICIQPEGIENYTRDALESSS